MESDAERGADLLRVIIVEHRSTFGLLLAILSGQNVLICAKPDEPADIDVANRHHSPPRAAWRATAQGYAEVTPTDRIAELRAIMTAHDLTRGDVARILGLTPRHGGSHGTVDGWLSGARGMPAAKLELIGMKAPGWKTTRQVV